MPNPAETDSAMSDARGRSRTGPRRFLLAVSILLVVLAGGYTVFWFVAANRIEDGAGRWAEVLGAQNLDLSWHTSRVGGFPWIFELELRELSLRRDASLGALEIRMPLLLGSTNLQNFRAWQLSAQDGLSARAGGARGSAATLTAPTAQGSVVLSGERGADIWFGLPEPVIETGVRMPAERADLWLTVPERPPQAHTDPALGVALRVRAVTLPTVPAPFHNPLDELAFGATVMGAIPPGPPRQAADLWRESGGTLELDHLSLRWGTLAITGSGTVALDAELQPEGAFSGTVEGYNELIAALVEAGHMRRGESQLARLALGFLAKPGPDGTPQIATSFRIQNGGIFLGPVRLGQAPRIMWE
jgi:hypothetical protein